MRLQWEVDGTGVVLWIDGIGDVTGTELEVRPLVSRSWTLRATNPGGRASAEAAVVADGSPPSVAIWTAPAEPGFYEVGVSTVGEDAPREATASIEVRAEAPVAATFESAGGNYIDVDEPENQAVVEDDGTVWVIPFASSGLFRLDPSADRWRPVATSFEPAALARTTDGTMWIGHATDGVARLVVGAAAWESVGQLVVVSGDQVFVPDDATGVWRRTAQRAPAKLREIVAVGAWLYGYTMQIGVWRMPLAGE